MASNNNMEVKRPPHKTYSAFNALPTLRARDRRDSEKSPSRAFKRPPQMADQLLFPGRRLDRLQRSTYSGYSGRSLEIETIVSGGRLNDNNSVVSVTKPGTGISSGFSRSLNDVTNQPWDSLRQLPSAHSHLSLLSNHSKQNTPLSGTRPRGLAAQIAGGSVSMGNLNADNNFRPNKQSFPAASGRWQLSEPHRQQYNYNTVDKTIISCSSPDSSYSSEAASELHDPTPIPPPPIQLHRTQPSQTRESKTFLKKPRRHSETSNVSRTPQLDKILWALVPDEFANISDAGISEHGQGNTSPHYLTFTDLEHSDVGSSDDEGATSRHPSTRVPATPRRPALTEETLSNATYKAPIPCDDRIQKWLAECDAHMPSNKLPTHLPDINYTFKYSTSKS